MDTLPGPSTGYRKRNPILAPAFGGVKKARRPALSAAVSLLTDNKALAQTPYRSCDMRDAFGSSAIHNRLTMGYTGAKVSVRRAQPRIAAGVSISSSLQVASQILALFPTTIEEAHGDLRSP